MARKIKKTSNNIPEIIFSLAPPLNKQGKDCEELRNSSSKNNKSHKKRKNKREDSKKNNLPEIIITSVSDDEDEDEKVLTVSNSNNSNTKLPKIIINAEDNEIISTSHEFVDFDFTSDDKLNQNISNESFNNDSRQQKEERKDKNLFQNKENIINKNISSNVSSDKISKIQLLRFLKKKILG
uniref:Uncharacterized protein n=1 Tax=Anthurium amnicola TaxID=1678845 RepID=A0A1D1ZG49_9ARAE